MCTRGVDGCTDGAVFGLSWKVSIVAPDSGQNLETRIWPGGVWKMLSLAVLEVVGGPGGGVWLEEGGAGSRSCVVVVSGACGRRIVWVSWRISAETEPGSWRSGTVEGRLQVVLEVGMSKVVSGGARGVAPESEVSGS